MNKTHECRNPVGQSNKNRSKFKKYYLFNLIFYIWLRVQGGPAALIKIKQGKVARVQFRTAECDSDPSSDNHAPRENSSLTLFQNVVRNEFSEERCVFEEFRFQESPRVIICRLVIEFSDRIINYVVCHSMG
jgi:hypothetical protein